MLCPKCGFENREGVSFCEKCGSPLNNPVPEIPVFNQDNSAANPNPVMTPSSVTTPNPVSTPNPVAPTPAVVVKQSHTGVVIALVIGALCLAIIIGVFAYFIVGSMNDVKKENNDTSINTDSDTNDVESNENMKDIFKDAFMEGCVAEGGNEDFCKCGFEYLVKELGIDGLMSMGIKSQSGEELSEKESSAYSNATTNCISKF